MDFNQRTYGREICGNLQRMGRVAAVNFLFENVITRTDGKQEGKRQQDERRVLFKQRVGRVEAAIQNVQQCGGEARRVEREEHAWRGSGLSERRRQLKKPADDRMTAPFQLGTLNFRRPPPRQRAVNCSLKPLQAAPSCAVVAVDLLMMLSQCR
jgi:hypothetical protein